jgi:proteasome lid subunit RPN8/RPN11
MSYLKSKNWIRPSLLWRERPRNNANYVRFSPTAVGFELFIRNEVLRAAYGAALQALPNETIGLLAGRVCQDPEGSYTVADAVEGAEGKEVYATPHHVRISAEDYAQLRRRLEMAHPILEMVGWFHSHPRLPPQFSLDDRQEQLTWPDINHVALVVSCGAWGERFGVYHGPNSIQMFQQND